MRLERDFWDVPIRYNHRCGQNAKDTIQLFWDANSDITEQNYKTADILWLYLDLYSTVAPQEEAGWPSWRNGGGL